MAPTPLLGSRTLDRQTARTLPPGPKLPTLVQTWLFASHRRTFFPRMRDKYGGGFTIRPVPTRRAGAGLGPPGHIPVGFGSPPPLMLARRGRTPPGPHLVS